MTPALEQPNYPRPANSSISPDRNNSFTIQSCSLSPFSNPSHDGMLSVDIHRSQSIPKCFRRDELLCQFPDKVLTIDMCTEVSQYREFPLSDQSYHARFLPSLATRRSTSCSNTSIAISSSPASSATRVLRLFSAAVPPSVCSVESMCISSWPLD